MLYGDQQIMVALLSRLNRMNEPLERQDTVSPLG